MDLRKVLSRGDPRSQPKAGHSANFAEANTNGVSGTQAEAALETRKETQQVEKFQMRVRGRISGESVASLVEKAFRGY
jgi:hypothetical protein